MTKKRRVWLFTAIAVAVAAGAAVFAGVQWSKPGDPRETVESYLVALENEKADGGKQFLCEKWRVKGIKGIKGSAAQSVNWNGIFRHEILKSEVTARSATVTASVSFTVVAKQDSGRLQITLVDENGDWRVCEIHAS